MEDYATILNVSREVCWNIEDLIGPGVALDFSRPFLPDSMAGAQLSFLSHKEQIALNQIRAHSYLYLFRLAEEFILPFVIDYARDQRGDDDAETQALLQFACEEAKHIQLFKHFVAEFQRGFGTPCEVIGPPGSIARVVLEHSQLGVALSVLHIEWMTQRHFVESARDDAGIDEHFRKLLKFHWIEEAQHTKLDTLMIRKLAQALDAQAIAEGIEDYVRTVAYFDTLLGRQMRLDLESFQRAIGRSFSTAEQAALAEAQTRATRRTFLVSAMTHPSFLATVEELLPSGRRSIERMAEGFA